MKIRILLWFLIQTLQISLLLSMFCSRITQFTQVVSKSQKKTLRKQTCTSKILGDGHEYGLENDSLLTKQLIDKVFDDDSNFTEVRSKSHKYNMRNKSRYEISMTIIFLFLLWYGFWFLSFHVFVCFCFFNKFMMTQDHLIC